jgi:hypothetical protein
LYDLLFPDACLITLFARDPSFPGCHFDFSGKFDYNPKKGVPMEVKDYCNAMLAEVNAWKNKLDAMKKTADSYSTQQKEKVLPLIGQLEQEVATAQMRVDQLEKECPSDWSPTKNELDDLFGTIGSNVNRAWKDLEGGNVGG